MTNNNVYLTQNLRLLELLWLARGRGLLSLLHHGLLLELDKLLGLEGGSLGLLLTAHTDLSGHPGLTPRRWGDHGGVGELGGRQGLRGQLDQPRDSRCLWQRLGGQRHCHRGPRQ